MSLRCPTWYFSDVYLFPFYRKFFVKTNEARSSEKFTEPPFPSMSFIAALTLALTSASSAIFIFPFEPRRRSRDIKAVAKVSTSRGSVQSVLYRNWQVSIAMYERAPVCLQTLHLSLSHDGVMMVSHNKGDTLFFAWPQPKTSQPALNTFADKLYI